MTDQAECTTKSCSRLLKMVNYQQSAAMRYHSSFLEGKLMTYQCLRMLWIYMVCIIAFLSRAEAGQPNVILIFADDQGYGDLSCFGKAVNMWCFDCL